MSTTREFQNTLHLGTPNSNEFDASFASKHEISTSLDSSTPWHQMDVKTLLGELRSRQMGGYQTSGKLNDWCISRQRYWGTPIPIIHCDHCGVRRCLPAGNDLANCSNSRLVLSLQAVPVPENELPIRLPSIRNIQSSSKTGTSPLASAHEWLKTSCPK